MASIARFLTNANEETKVVRGWPLPLSGKDGMALVFRQLAPLAGSEAWGEMELTDGDAEEPESREAGGGSHFADLAVTAFAQGEFDPAGWDVQTMADGWIARSKVGVDGCHLGGAGHGSFEDDATAQFL